MKSIPYPQVEAPPPGCAIRLEVLGTPVAVFNVQGKFRAIEARCPHRAGPLEKGQVESQTVTCPWHGSQFDLETGRVIRGPATAGVRAYPVHLDGAILVIEAP